MEFQILKHNPVVPPHVAEKQNHLNTLGTTIVGPLNKPLLNTKSSCLN